VTARFPSPGEAFGNYVVIDRIGLGGMGVVFTAIHQRINRRVALKVLRPELADDPEYRERFSREAATLASLDSPHIVQIYDQGEIEGCPYIATQFVAEGDLGHWLQAHGGLPVVQALEIVEQVADAVSDAHQVGILHRDIKPSNVLIRRLRDGGIFAYVCDFGIAKAQDSDLTRSANVMGTSGYLAPERYLGLDATPREASKSWCRAVTCVFVGLSAVCRV
jgi:serine/threonine-protein kinase